MAVYEKMSKSKGNTVSVDEVVYGVRSIREGFELRDEQNQVVDPREVGAWESQETFEYFTAVRMGKRPLWLCMTGEPVPPLVREKVQHRDEIDYWMWMLSLYEDAHTVHTVDEVMSRLKNQ